ncbi:unnamed protein product [Arabis nemorensis]|uniref:Uncharacterized protein n=1 Tax=Arabis nemorensis TaxID=586526 RepID=A0A565C5E1_9BRAS|nr:unnamed protein product [Arabis nemorensis]
MVVTAKQMWLRLASTSDRVIPEDLLSLFARTGPEQLSRRHPPEPPDPPDPPDTTSTPSPSFTTAKTYARPSTPASLPDPSGTRSGASRVGLHHRSSPSRHIISPGSTYQSQASSHRPHRWSLGSPS